MFNQALILSAALLLSAPSVGAQQSHQHTTGAGQETGMMATCMMQSEGMDENTMALMSRGMEMSGGMEMMSSSAAGPAMLIRMGQILDLDERQIAELEAIQAELTGERASQMPLVMEAHQQAAELNAGGDTDLAAYEEALRQAMDHMISVRVSVARAALDARAVLTDEQAARLDGAMGMMRRMESMGDGGMGGMMSDQNSEDTPHEHGPSSGGNP